MEKLVLVVIVRLCALSDGAAEAEYKDLASELKILIHLGQHKNIINLLGACTRGKRLMVIMEFAPHGSFLSFIRAKREIYDATWTKTTNNPEQEFTLVDLAMAAYQISRGMAFLASKKVCVWYCRCPSFPFPVAITFNKNRACYISDRRSLEADVKTRAKATNKLYSIFITKRYH